MGHCDECVHMVYQYDLEGDMIPFCILKNEPIENESKDGCFSFKEYPF